jgi:hypothetical protein
MALLSVRLPDQMNCFVLWDPEQSLQDLCEQVLHRQDISHLIACSPQFGDPIETRDWIDSRDRRFQEATMQSLGLNANDRLTLILRPAYLKMANLIAHQQMLAKTDDVLVDFYSSDEDIETAPLRRINMIDSSLSEVDDGDDEEEEEETGDGVQDKELCSSDESSAFAEIALTEVESTSESSEDDSIELTGERYILWNKKITKRQKKQARLMGKKKAKEEANRRAKNVANKTVREENEAAMLTAERRLIAQSQGKSKLILDGAMSVTLYAKLSVQ